MSRHSITYTVKYEIDFASNYKFTTCGLCINTKTSRLIKKVYKNGSIGYSIKGRFYSLTKLRKHLVKPVILKCPF